MRTTNTVESSVDMVYGANCAFDNSNEYNAVDVPHRNTVESSIAMVESGNTRFDNSNKDNAIVSALIRFKKSPVV